MWAPCLLIVSVFYFHLALSEGRFGSVVPVVSSLSGISISSVASSVVERESAAISGLGVSNSYSGCSSVRTVSGLCTTSSSSECSATLLSPPSISW